jgi:CheY-like chemotaxis protein
MAIEAFPTRILLIEDDLQDIDLIQDYLTKSKHFEMILETVSCLGEGLERLRKGGIDLVLSDLSLPDELGLDTSVSFIFNTLISQLLFSAVWMMRKSP